jgi:D-alanyl-D-alanine carboxypeptidase/D-alanyl-D-alanine-endopeptidase (penicillin-binding protein 4)
MRIFTFLILSLFSPFLSGYAQNNSFDKFFSTGSLKTASYSIYVVDAKTGEKITASDQKSLSTASAMKLFTTAVALDVLGPDYTFSTSLAYTGNVDPKTGILAGNLIIKGEGDPAFYSTWFEDHYRNCFDNWIAQLKKSGIKTINGQLLLDLSAMKDATIPGGWAWEDTGNYYGAGVSALTFADNLYEIHFASPKAAGMPVTIRSKNPEIEGLILDNKVLSSARTGDHTIAYGAPGSLHQYIEGTIPVDQTDFVVRLAMPDPPAVAASAFLRKMKENEIPVTGGISKIFSDDGTKKTILCTQLSPPLKDLIVPLNKESLNLFAEHLLCEVGRKKSGEASMDKGIEAYRLFCTDHGIDSQGFYPEDGSGLTRSNAMTSQTLVETMKHVYDGPCREIFFNSLPVAGIDGTLKNSFKGTPLEKNVRAKTGSMSRVRSIAGALKTRSGKEILFAIMINNFDLTSSETSKLLESILLSFYND